MSTTLSPYVRSLLTSSPPSSLPPLLATLQKDVDSKKLELSLALTGGRKDMIDGFEGLVKSHSILSSLSLPLPPLSSSPPPPPPTQASTLITFLTSSTSLPLNLTSQHLENLKMYKSELLLPKLCTNWDQISDYIKLKNIASSVELILVFFTSLSLKIKSLQSFELNTFLKTADSLIASLSKQIKISTGEFGLIKNPVSEIVSVVSCEKVRLKKVLEMRIRKLSPFKWDLEGGKGKFWDFFKGTVELISDERVSRLLELSNPPLAELSKPGVFILLLQKPSFKILKYYSTLTGTGCFEEEIVSDTVEWKEVKKGIKWKGSLRREFVDVILNSGKETLTQIGEIEVALDIWRKILIGSVRDRVKVLMNYKFLYGLSGPVLNLGIRIIEEGEGWGDLEVLGLRFKEEGDELEKCEVREESEIWAREGFWCLKEVFKNVKNSEGKKGGRDVGKMFRRERRWERKRVGEKRKEEEREKTGWW